MGDWSSWKNFSTTTETRTHGAAHELTRIGSGTTPATILYDTKGNISQNQRTPGTSSTYQNYVWDFDNRMISADTNGDNTADVTFEYDALGRRVARTQGATAVVYIHAGQQVVCDYTRGANANTTPAFQYVWGDYIDEPILRQTGSSTLLYCHHNQQYSTVALTSASGLVVTRYGYTAYGDQTIHSHTGASQTYATYSNRISYTGRDWDDSLKAHYFRARWYDAALGRFVNRDPLAYIDGLSFYRAYFEFDSLDPTGLYLEEIDPSGSDPSDSDPGVCSVTWTDVFGDRYFLDDNRKPLCQIYQDHHIPVIPNGCSVPQWLLDSNIPGFGDGQTARFYPNRGPGRDGRWVDVQFFLACNEHDYCWADCSVCHDDCENEFEINLKKLCDDAIDRTDWLQEEKDFAKNACYQRAELYRSATTGGGRNIFLDERRSRCFLKCPCRY